MTFTIPPNVLLFRQDMEGIPCARCGQPATHILALDRVMNSVKTCTAQECIDANARRVHEATWTVLNYWCVTCCSWSNTGVSTMEHPLEFVSRTYRAADELLKSPRRR